MPRHAILLGCLLLAPMLAFQAADRGEAPPPEGWKPVAPRDEIRPRFAAEAEGGPDRAGALVIHSSGREARQGWWEKSFPVKGGGHYRFATSYRAEGVSDRRRSVLARILWQDDAGKKVPQDRVTASTFAPPWQGLAEPEYPRSGPAKAGWTPVGGVFRAPPRATRAVVELTLQWAPGGSVRWGAVSLESCPPPAPRVVRLATVHYTPRGGKTPADNCQQFAPLIAKAAAKKADLVVLGETLTYVGLGKSFPEVAEPVPGPSTAYFGGLAKEHGLYLVVGLVERAGPQVYNVAVLIGPDGQVAGKYRKVCLPRGEVEGGLTPGAEYPVFTTRFGKVGLMVCYDGFFPEVARGLTKGGAEVIAWPVWGCNPLLARARACENHVYLVSSTYCGTDLKWMLSAVYDREGSVVAQGQEWGDVAVTEVDLAAPTVWTGLGDFRAEMERHRP